MARLLARRGVLASGVGITPPPPPEGGAYAAAVMADSPFAYWRLDETTGLTVADDQGNHDGTVNGAILNATGQVGTAAYFDGTSDIDLGTLGTFGSGLDDGFTIELWFRFTGIERQVIVGQINDGTANTSLFVMANRSASDSERIGGIRVQVRGEGSSIRGRHTDRTDLNDGRWHHLVATWEGPGNDLDLYVDGVLDNGDATGTGTSATADLNRALTIGALNDRGTLVDHYHGRVDELALYDYVLPSARVAAHYAERDEAKDDGDGVVATGGQVSDILVGGTPWRVHRFTDDDDFVVTTGGDVEYLIVGGGGSGGWGRGGGGGAGGRRTNIGGTMLTLSPDTYPVVVGDGGPPPAAITDLGINGDPSSALGIEAAGGGGGGETDRAGLDGGSGGGGGGQGSQPGGDGNVPSVSPAQGNDGGAGNTATSGSARAGGGGGGSDEAGGDGGVTTNGGVGGDGAESTFEGPSERLAAGGGGGTDSTPGAGGDGGGGDGANSNAEPGEGGTGSGGGGSHSGVSGPGGRGVVMIRYPLET